MKFILDDCMEWEIPKCRLLLTDIPYNGVNLKSNGLRQLDRGLADSPTFELNKFLDHIYDSADIFCIFCGIMQVSEIFKYFYNKPGTARIITWCKTNPSPMNGEYVYLSGTEFAVWFKKKGTGKLNKKCCKNYYMFPSGSSKLHPTEKNHKLLEEIILTNTNPGDLIVDPCMGSGSTALVATKLGRDFWGCEINEDWYNLAVKRWKEL